MFERNGICRLDAGPPRPISDLPMRHARDRTVITVARATGEGGDGTAMKTADKFFMAFVIGVMVIGLGIVALFLSTGPTANQVRAIDGPAEPVTPPGRKP